MILKYITNDFYYKDLFCRNFVRMSDKERELIRNWRNNDDVKKWMYNDDPISFSEHAKFINSLRNDDKNVYWMCKNEKEYLGVISLNHINWKHQSAYLGLYKNPHSLQKSIGTKLLDTLKHIAFNILNFHTLKAEVFETNTRAFNLYIKSGFQVEGKLIEIVNKQNCWINIIVMGMINNRERDEEWNEK